MGESRQELLNWLNSLLQLNTTRVEQCGTGAAFCQIFDSIFRMHPSSWLNRTSAKYVKVDVPMSRVKFNVNTEYAYLNNFKILTSVFALHKIDRVIDVPALVKCKMQDNLEFLQWSKRYWDQHYPGGEYDAVGRRKGQSGPTSTPASSSRPAAGAKPRGTTPNIGGARTRTPLGGASTSALQNEINGLKETVAGLERERDFYFSKLRDIELLLQGAAESDDAEDDKDAVIKRVQAILYSTEEGFEIPDEGLEEHAGDDETF